MRQFPDTRTARKPLRLPDSGCSRQPGTLRSCGETAYAPGQLAPEGIEPFVRADLQGEHQAAQGRVLTQEADQFRVHGHSARR